MLSADGDDGCLCLFGVMEAGHEYVAECAVRYGEPTSEPVRLPAVERLVVVRSVHAR
jgi:hypothetical protein